ncbi:MAG: AAA family ATPase [Clostridia bacterium]
MNKIVAIVGMCGSGKSVLCDMFTNDGWAKVYFGGVTIDKMTQQGLEVNEVNERATREGLRATYGQGAFAILLVDKITDLSHKSNVVLDGLYSWSEYKVLKEKFGESFSVLAVTTNRSIRYSRLSSRPIRPLNEEQARSRDYSEIENIEKGGPIAIADYYIVNNGNEEDMREQYHRFISQL